MNELDLLRQIALKALEMFDSGDLWIDGLEAGYRAEELSKLARQWKAGQYTLDHQEKEVNWEVVENLYRESDEE